jgi:hypothetical protein
MKFSYSLAQNFGDFCHILVVVLQFCVSLLGMDKNLSAIVLFL